MSRPAITVIVPVYKAMATLERCIESIVTQKVEGGLACILVDDGSPDDSGQLCDAWAQMDGRIRVIHQDDRGVSGARNSGLAAADSDYIVFLDSDDALRPGALQAALDAQNAAPDSFVCWHYTTDEKDTAPVTAAAERRQPRAAQGSDGLVVSHTAALGRVAAHDVGDTLGKNRQLGAVQRAHILRRAGCRVAGLIQLGKMLRPDAAIVRVILRRQRPRAAAIVEGQRRGEHRVAKFWHLRPQQDDIIQYKL